METVRNEPYPMDVASLVRLVEMLVTENRMLVEKDLQPVTHSFERSGRLVPSDITLSIDSSIAQQQQG